MANPTVGFGFQPSRRLDGASPNAQLIQREIASDNTNKIHQYSPVIELASGYIDIAAATDAPVFGVMIGVEYYDINLQQMVYAPAWLGVATALAGSVKALIVPATPNQLFKVRNSGTVMTIADVGANAKLEAVAGDDNTKLSKFRLDQATINTTNTFPFRIWGIADSQGAFNDKTLANNIVEVLIVNNSVTATTGKA